VPKTLKSTRHSDQLVHVRASTLYFDATGLCTGVVAQDGVPVPNGTPIAEDVFEVAKQFSWFAEVEIDAPEPAAEPEPEEPAPEPEPVAADSIDTAKKPQLLEVANGLGIEGADDMKVAELRDAIQEAWSVG